MLPVVALGTVGALSGAFRRVLANIAFRAIDSAGLGLVLATAAWDASVLSLIKLVVSCEETV
eukprot:1601312-Prymnesium_polylepis.1